MRILGIDPGLRNTGFGLIDHDGAKLSYVASGTIVVPPEQALYQRLNDISSHLYEVIDSYKPDVAVIEKVFLNTNPQSTLLLGHARGAAMLSLAQKGLAVSEYTALQVKKAVVGRGHAQKEQVQAMVQYILKLNALPAPDPADALACAICHAHAAPLSQRLQAHQKSTLTVKHRIRNRRLIG
ncbi:MAG: crossover junction endodeoxyribonuclease RuvC [Alcaligenaceae bacterium]|jgi:crossover junction endodeoxyribonuclease RuvC|nr:crossover junction endodeoxyribonuclease RuvC [Alcaligenaceae bacterium]